jgi:hypothetical protein
MPLEKMLQRIQAQIADLGNLSEPFLEENIQPSVGECDKLSAHLHQLLECLAVYKHHKHDNELEPSFNIHAKISEKQPAITQESASPVTPVHKSPVVEQAKVPETETQPQKTRPPLTIGINDKFRFINELFSQNSSEYNIVLEQLANLNSWHETDIYLSSLKNVYGWKDSNEVVKYFYSVVKKRFD